jgi:hypothetical protein
MTLEQAFLQISKAPPFFNRTISLEENGPAAYIVTMMTAEIPSAVGEAVRFAAGPQREHAAFNELQRAKEFFDKEVADSLKAGFVLLQ